MSIFLLGLAIAIHGASVIDGLGAVFADIRVRLLYNVLALVLLVSAVYLPAGWLLGQVATPLRFALAAPPFAAGDVVLVSYMAYVRSKPEPGDIVFYSPTTRQLRYRYAEGRVYNIQGDHIDRVIARGGQTVTSDHGQLLVDGEPSQWLPLNPVTVPDKLKVTVPQDCYFIYPTVDPYTQQYTLERVADGVRRASCAYIGPRVLAAPTPLATGIPPLIRTP